MKQFIKDIIFSNEEADIKLQELDEIIEDIQTAKEVINLEYTYCEDCDDYYLTSSYGTKNEIKEEKICTYEDPINSGGNEYTMGKVYYLYSICPKGHKKIVYKERKN